MKSEKDFFKTCFNTVASLEVKNESQAIAKEVVLSEIEQLQQENNQLKLINQEHQQINGELRQANKLLNEQYIRLYKDYEQLKDNWNKLKEIVKSQSEFKKQADLKDGLWFEIDELLDKMQELEQGNDSND